MEYRDVKLKIELDVEGARETAANAGSSPAGVPGPGTARQPRVVPGGAAAGGAGSPGQVGTPGAPGGAGSPGAPGTVWAPVPGAPAGSPAAGPVPGRPGATTPAPGAAALPGGLSPAQAAAARRQIAATVQAQVGQLFVGATPGTGAVTALARAGASAAALGGAVPPIALGVAAAAVAVGAAERYGPGLAAALERAGIKIPPGMSILGGPGAALLEGDNAERFSRGLARVRGKLTAALDIGQNLEGTMTDQAVLFGKTDLPLAARQAYAQYRIDTKLNALERYRKIYESERFAGSTDPVTALIVALGGGLSSLVGR